MAGFELATPCTPCKCATRLRYAPKEKDYSRAKNCLHALTQKILQMLEKNSEHTLNMLAWALLNARDILVFVDVQSTGAPSARERQVAAISPKAMPMPMPATSRIQTRQGQPPRQRNRDCATRLHKHAITHAAHGSSGHADFKNKGDVLPANTAPARGRRERKRNQAAGADTPED